MASIPYVVDDLGGVIQIFSDGSINRNKLIDPIIPVKDDGSVKWKDYNYNKTHNLNLRIYKPQSSTTKLPVIYYLHGGGFCIGTFTRPKYHNLCLRISSYLHVILVEPDLRLAPEHRLPAAMDDSLSALEWLQDTARNLDGDVVDFFDFDQFFVMGDSSGGNIAHHLAARFRHGSPELTPIKIRGYVMISPFFGGTDRTMSEAKGLPEKVLNVDILDTFWRMSLPIGKTADHPFANPFGPSSLSLELVKLDPILIMVGQNEIMKDRVQLYAKRLEELGKIAQYVEFEGKQHGFFTNEPYSDVSESVLKLVKDFMFQHSCCQI